MKGRRPALLAFVALAGIGAVAWPTLRGLGGGPDVPTAVVAREDFLRRVVAEGNLKAVNSTPLSAPVDAPQSMKIAWLAPDGSKVKAGEVVVRFDPTDLEKNRDDGQADRTSARERIEGREAEERAALANLGRDAAMASLERDYARRFQRRDETIFSRLEIIESEIDETLAGRRQEHAEAAREVRKSQGAAELSLLRIEEKKAHLKVSLAEKGLSSLELAAPHDGILVYQRDWRGDIPRVGESVWPGEPVAEIPEPSTMEAEVFVLEADAGGLEVGKKAEVRLESVPGRVFPASIRKVEALAKPRMRWLPVQYFGVTLALPETLPAIMKPGQRVRALLTLEERPGALVVPREAVFEKDGKRFVRRRAGSGFERAEVTLGPSALGRVVVETGLAEGDEVALRDPELSPEQAAPAEGEPAPPTALGNGR